MVYGLSLDNSSIIRRNSQNNNIIVLVIIIITLTLTLILIIILVSAIVLLLSNTVVRFEYLHLVSTTTTKNIHHLSYHF